MLLPWAILLGDTSSLPGLYLPFNFFKILMASLQNAAKKRSTRGFDEPIQVVLRLACLGELRPFRASTLFAPCSNASSCVLDRVADGGHRPRGALWALHPCVFVRLLRRGGRYGCFCSRVMTGEVGQAFIEPSPQAGNLTPSPSRDRLTDAAAVCSGQIFQWSNLPNTSILDVI